MRIDQPFLRRVNHEALLTGGRSVAARFFNDSRHVWLLQPLFASAKPSPRSREIALGPGGGAERPRALAMTIETMNAARYLSDRNPHDMIEAALNENWPIIADHNTPSGPNQAARK
jgi:hypothetical protein